MDKPHSLEDAFAATLPEREERHAAAVAELGYDPSKGETRQTGKVKELAAHYGKPKPQAPSFHSRLALITILTPYFTDATTVADAIIAELWAQGHKIAPLDPELVKMPEGVDLDLNLYITSPKGRASAEACAVDMSISVKGLTSFVHKMLDRVDLERLKAAKMLPPFADDWRVMTAAEIAAFKKREREDLAAATAAGGDW